MARFCGYCGTPLDPETGLCPKCNAGSIQMVPAPDDVIALRPEAAEMEPHAEAEDSEPAAIIPSEIVDTIPDGTVVTTQASRRRGLASLPVRYILILALILLVAASGALVAAYRYYRPEVSLNPYLTVSFQGYESVGHAVVVYDAERFVSENAGRLHMDRWALRRAQQDADPGSALGEFLNELDTQATLLADGDPACTEEVLGAVLWGQVDGLDPADHYANDDTVIYHWGIDPEIQTAIEDIYHCTLLYEDVTYTVSGLQAVGEYDPFQNVTVTFDGASPDGTASLNVDGSDRENTIRYSLDHEDRLSNGDTVVLTAEPINGDEDDIETYGNVLSPRSQTYTVAGLTEYITGPNDLSDDELQQLRELATQGITTQFEQDVEEILSLSNIGEIYITANEGVDVEGKYNGIDSAILFCCQLSFRTYGRTYNRYTYIAGVNVRREPDGVTMDYAPGTFLCKLDDPYVFDCFYDAMDTIRWDLDENRCGSDYTRVESLEE